MEIGALSLLISEKGFDATMQKVAALDAAAAKVGAKQTELRVTSPTALAVEAALARVGATATRVASQPVGVRLTLSGLPEAQAGLAALGVEKTKAAAPVVAPVSVSGVAAATTALNTLDAEKAQAGAPVTIPVALTGTAAVLAAFNSLDAEKAQASAPVVVPVAPPNVGPAVAALGALVAEKAGVSTPLTIPVTPPNIAPAVAAFGALATEKAQASQPVVVPVQPPNITAAVGALDALDTAKAQASAPVTVAVLPPNVGATVAALEVLDAEKAQAASPVTIPVAVTGVAPAVAVLGGLEAAKVGAETPVVIPVPPPNTAPAVAALGTLDAAKAHTAAPVVVPVATPNIAPAVAALGVLDTEKAQAAAPVTVSVQPPNLAPVLGALNALDAEKSQAGAPVTVPVVAPNVGPAVAALNTLDTEKAQASTPVVVGIAPPNVAPALAALGAVVAEKATVSTPLTVPVTTPNVAPAVAALGVLAAEKATVAAPLTVSVPPPNVTPALTAAQTYGEGLKRAAASGSESARSLAVAWEQSGARVAEAMARARAGAVAGALGPQAQAPTTATLAEQQAARVQALNQALQQFAEGSGLAAQERALGLSAALAQDTEAATRSTSAAKGLSVAEREGADAIAARTRALNALIAAQNEASRATNIAAQQQFTTPAPVRGAAQLGPATPEVARQFEQQARAAQEMAAQTQQAAAAQAALVTQTARTGNETEKLSPKLRSAANGLTAVAFAATATNGSFQSMALGAGLAASSLASMVGGPLALWAAGIGAAITVGVALVGVLNRIAGSAEAAAIQLEHVGNIRTPDAAANAFRSASAEVERLTEKLGEMDQKVKAALLESGSTAGIAELGRVAFERLKVLRQLERAQDVLGATQVRQAEVVRETERETALARRDAAVSAARDQLTITEALIQQQESLNTQGYALGQINLAEYFRTREEMAARHSDAMLRSLQAERGALGAPPPGRVETEDEAIQRRTRLASVEAQIEAENTRRRTADRALMAEKEAAERALAIRLAGFERIRLEAQGQTHEARLKQIEIEAEEYQRALAIDPTLSPESKAALVSAFRDALTLQEDFNNAQREAGRVFAEMGRERERVNRLVESGQLTEAQGQQQIIALERARLPVLQGIADQMLTFAETLKNPDLIAAAKALRGEIEGIGRTPMAPLAARVKAMMDELSVEAAGGDRGSAALLKEIQQDIDAAGGVITVGIAVKAEWAKRLKDQIEAEFALLEILIQPKNIILTGVADALSQLNQQLAGLATNVGNSIGNALADGFASAFTKDSGKSFFESFGNSLLQGVGGIMVQLGSAMLTYGLITAVAAPLLALTPFAAVANPLSAGAAITAGTALIALGAGLGAIASNNTGNRTGGGGAGGARGSQPRDLSETRQVVLDPDRRLREARQVAPSVNVRESAKATTAAPVTNHFVVIGANDPKVQRDIGDIVERAIRRNLIPSLA